jgi:type VI protein secretion system component Hcp
MAVDAFMVLTEKGGKVKIKGESTDEEMAKLGAFEIISFQWGASREEKNKDSGHKGLQGSGTDKTTLANAAHSVAHVEHFKIAKPFDLASTGLFSACLDPNRVLEKAEIFFRKTGDHSRAEGPAGPGGAGPESNTFAYVYLRFVFEEVRILGVDWKIEAIEGGSDKPDQEDVKCSFRKCDIYYTPQSQAGSSARPSPKSATYDREAAKPADQAGK